MTTGTHSSASSQQDANAILAGAKPLFLFGAARSGTTFLCRILNAHPKVIMTNESAVFLQLGELIRRSHIGISEGIIFGKSYYKVWSEVLRDESRRLVEQFYAQVAQQESDTSSESSQVSYYGDKHPHLFTCFDLLEQVYQDAVYIHLARDPRDAALSIAKMSGDSYQDSLRNWKIFDDHNRVFIERTDPSLIRCVKYEDLVENPIGVTKTLFQSLGLDQHQRVVQYLEEYASVDAHTIKDRDGSDAGGNTDAFVQRTNLNLGRWKEALTQEDQEFTDELICDALNHYGYPLCSNG